MDKFNLVVRAARELARAVQENYYDLSDLNIINYSEVCEWCNFPDLQDGGIYEQAIDAAAKIIIEIIKNRRIMTQLQQFLFELSFRQTRRIREYMLKQYNVYCGSMKDLEQAINDYIPNEDILEELSEVLA